MYITHKRAVGIIVLLLFFCCAKILAQDESSPDYLRNPKLPEFALLKIDSATLTKESLLKDKQVLIILFSPQCGHCRLLTDSIVASIDFFKNIEILMTSFNPMDEMAAFYNEFHLSRYPNIKFGRDIKYFFTPFFDAEGYPFLALYNSKGKLITQFTGRVPVSEILSSFKIKATNSLKFAKNN
jgi:thioredoxin-related protein